jgi:Bacterial membrane protein YfhO
MNPTELKNGLKNHGLAIAVFLVILMAYFKPAFFDHKTLVQHDVMEGLAASHEAIEYREKTGEEALWTNSIFGGMPLYITNVVYSGDLVSLSTRILKLIPRPADNVMLSLVCFYILLVIVGCRSWIALLGAFAYAFTSFHIISIEAGHIYKSWAMAYVPLIFAGIILTYRGKYILGLAISALAVSLELSAQHYQITYYLAFIVAIFIVSQFIFALKEKALPSFFKASALLAIAAILGIGTNAGRLWALQEYGKYSIRSKSELIAKTTGEEGSQGLDRDYAFDWSQGKMETFTLLIPDFYGGASHGELGKNSETAKLLKKNQVPAADAKNFLKHVPTYWGDQPFTSGPVYAGAIIVFLFMLGCLILDNKWRYWLLAATVLSIMLAWGKNFEGFNFFMFDYFPGYNKFRAVSMAIVIALFTLPFMAALALEKAVEFKMLPPTRVPVLNKSFNPVLLASAIVGGVLLLVILLAGMADFSAEVDKQLPEWLVDAVQSDRKSMLRTDGFRSLALVLLAAGLMFFYSIEKLSFKVLAISLCSLVIFDLYAVDKRYLNDEDFTKTTRETFFNPSPVDEMILKDKSLDYRVMNVQNPFNDALTSYYHKSVGGYHGVKMKRYQELIEYHLSKNNMKVLDMLNTKYFITGDAKQPLQQNPGALGNAWFVSSIRGVKNPDEEIAALTDFDPKDQAVLDTSKFKVSTKAFDQAGEIVLTEYKPNYLKYTMKRATPGFAVFSEIYYPEGWKATIDGKEAEFVRVNYVLRGMQVPAGSHIIEFRFDPPSYRIGNQLMLGSSIILIVAFVLGLGFAIKKGVS